MKINDVEAFVCFRIAQGDAFQFFKLAKEALDLGGAVNKSPRRCWIDGGVYAGLCGLDEPAVSWAAA